MLIVVTVVILCSHSTSVPRCARSGEVGGAWGWGPGSGPR